MASERTDDKVKEYQKTEIERIKSKTDLSDEEKSYLIRLVSMTPEERKAQLAKHTDLLRSLSYTITLTGEELEQLNFAASLNRRMFDRGPEHETLDDAFKIVLEKCASILNTEWDKIK